MPPRWRYDPQPSLDLTVVTRYQDGRVVVQQQRITLAEVAAPVSITAGDGLLSFDFCIRMSGAQHGKITLSHFQDRGNMLEARTTLSRRALN